MITRLPLVLIAFLTLLGGVPLRAAPPPPAAPKAVAREVRFFLLGELPALAMAEGTRRTELELTAYALSPALPCRGAKLVLHAAVAPAGVAAPAPLVEVALPAEAEQVLVILAPGPSATEPVKLVQLVDLSTKALPAGQVRVANLLPVELALMMGREKASLAPRASKVFAPSLDENASCSLKVAYANPQREGYLRLKEGGVFLPAPSRMLALAVLTQRAPAGEAGAARRAPKPEWLVYRL